MRSTLHFGRFAVDLEHRSCRDPHPVERRNLIVAPGCEPNTLTRLGCNDAEMFVFWQDIASGVNPHLLIAPETSVAFFGAGTVACTVSLPELNLIDLNELMLFWAFQRYGDRVVSLSEIEATLYSLDGRKRDSIPVDPPYEIEPTEDGIRFSSSSFGSQWLRFPKPTA